MNITSISFIAFFLLSLFVYLNLPHKLQWIWLLFNSIVYFLISCNWYTVAYLGISVCSVFLYTNNMTKMKKKSTWLVATIVLNVGILASLKYNKMILNPILEVINWGCKTHFVLDINWAAPLGISFYTLQIISYLMECYWGSIEPETNILKLALFTSYFPQMTMGPINRYENIATQLFAVHRFDYKRLTDGMIRIAWGFFEKKVVADRLGLLIDAMYSNIYENNGGYIWIAIILFPFQLYADFCGGIDIVMGISECYGIRMMENFYGPFYSKTIQELWQRWHISLGTWLKDYIMNPILKSDLFTKISDWAKQIWGKKKGKHFATYIAMLILWMCMGLWHGDSWKYVIGVGLWFWILLVLEKMLQPTLKKVYATHPFITNTIFFKILRMIKTYFLFAIGMIFFRASSFDEVFVVAKGMFSKFDYSILTSVSFWNIDLNSIMINILILIVGLIAMFRIDYLRYMHINVIDKLREKSLICRWIGYYAIIILVLISFNMNSNEFFYAQF